MMFCQPGEVLDLLRVTSETAKFLLLYWAFIHDIAMKLELRTLDLLLWGQGLNQSFLFFSQQVLL